MRGWLAGDGGEGQRDVRLFHSLLPKFVKGWVAWKLFLVCLCSLPTFRPWDKFKEVNNQSRWWWMWLGLLGFPNLWSMPVFGEALSESLRALELPKLMDCTVWSLGIGWRWKHHWCRISTALQLRGGRWRWQLRSATMSSGVWRLRWTGSDLSYWGQKVSWNWTRCCHDAVGSCAWTGAKGCGCIQKDEQCGDCVHIALQVSTWRSSRKNDASSGTEWKSVECKCWCQGACQHAENVEEELGKGIRTWSSATWPLAAGGLLTKWSDMLTRLGGSPLAFRVASMRQVLCLDTTPLPATVIELRSTCKPKRNRWCCWLLRLLRCYRLRALWLWLMRKTRSWWRQQLLQHEPENQGVDCGALLWVAGMCRHLQLWTLMGWNPKEGPRLELF